MDACSRTLRARCITGLLCSVSVVAAAGCGADFDSPDKVKTLRVFGVQKDHPYAAPTVDTASPSEVHLTMLSHDGSPLATATPTPGETPRTVQRLWFSGCDDLPGDEYFTCLLRTYYLWQAWSVSPTSARLNDVGSWSPVDDLDKESSQDDRNAALAPYLQLWNPSLPIELAEAYFNTVRIGAGEDFTYPIPPRIIENHQATTDSKIPPYGLAFVFFTVCAGQSPALEVAPEWKNIDWKNADVTTLTNATLGFPLICKDEKGTALNADDFIAGYTEEYVYGDGSANKNPVIEDSFTFGDTTYKVRPTIDDAKDKGITDPTVRAAAAAAAAEAFCLNDDCVPVTTGTSSTPVPSPNACNGDYSALVPHVTACSDHCPSYELKPGMDPAKNNDVDTFTSAGGSSVSEQMWIDYYADRGEFKGSARSLRDTTLGWFDDHGQKWKPPASAAAGPVLLWAVVHDNRGGAAWLRVQVCIDP
jgi:hypothetical protein